MANENTKRRSSRAAILGLILLGFILAGVGFLYSPSPDASQDTLLGTEAPDFEFERNGMRETLSSLRGKVVLINFWAHWCEPCLEEMPSLKKLEAAVGSPDFAVLLVQVGDEREEAQKLAIPAQLLAFDVTPSTLSSYGISGLPHSFLVDKLGVIRAVFEGPRDWTSESILKEIREPL